MYNNFSTKLSSFHRGKSWFSTNLTFCCHGLAIAGKDYNPKHISEKKTKKKLGESKTLVTFFGLSFEFLYI